jgi:putative addiction module component (TIGR02574 family)
MSIDLAEVLALPIEERIQLSQSIWDSVAAVPEAVQLTEDQRLELEVRLKEYRDNPTVGSPWSEVRERIISEP